MVTEAVFANPKTSAASQSGLDLAVSDEGGQLAIAQPEQRPTNDKLRSLGVLSPAEVDRLCNEEAHRPFLVDGILPAEGIAIAAGDSTIGKSPLMYQLGLCVAAGMPCLGHNTTKGRVLYFDLENALDDCRTIRNALVRFLSLGVSPDDFLLATEPNDLEKVISEVKPSLVIIDSLRAFAPAATKENSKTADWLNYVRRLTRKYHFAAVLIHHLRKPGEFSYKLSETVAVREFMLEMEGPRALVNQTDVRIALAQGNFNPEALRMKWSRRVHGDSPLVLLERVFDDDGEPAGYRPLTGAALLNEERRAALDKLPNEFRFKEAKAALGKSDAPTDNFLKECQQLGLVTKVPRAGYHKTTAPTTISAASRNNTDFVEWVKRCYKSLSSKRDTTLPSDREG